MDPDYALLARVVAAGSLSAAGREMGLSASMVSKRIGRLEARLGVQLLHRTTRRIALTEAGARFHGELVEILARLGAAEAALTGAAAGAVGPLSVSAPTSFGRLHVVPHLPAFLAAYPKVALRFDLSDAYVDLIGGRVDVAIRIAARVDAGLAAVRLAANARVVCAAPAYLAVHGAPGSPEDLARHRVLAAEGQMPWRLARGRREVVVDLPSAVATNSSEVVRELALGGAGVALRSLWDVGEALRDGRLVRVLPGWEGTRGAAIWTVRRAGGYPVPAAEAFVAFMAGRIDGGDWGDV